MEINCSRGKEDETLDVHLSFTKKELEEFFNKKVEKVTNDDDYIVYCCNDGYDIDSYSYLSKFNGVEDYSFNSRFDDALAMSYADALDTYNKLNGLKKKNDKAWVSKFDVMSFVNAKKLKERINKLEKAEAKKDYPIMPTMYYEESYHSSNDNSEKKCNYVLMFLKGGKPRYIMKSMIGAGCTSTVDLDKAQHFTKVGAVQALQKILSRYDDWELEPVIVYAPREEKDNGQED